VRVSPYGVKLAKAWWGAEAKINGGTATHQPHQATIK